MGAEQIGVTLPPFSTTFGGHCGQFYNLPYLVDVIEFLDAIYVIDRERGEPHRRQTGRLIAADNWASNPGIKSYPDLMLPSENDQALRLPVVWISISPHRLYLLLIYRLLHAFLCRLWRPVVPECRQ